MKLHDFLEIQEMAMPTIATAADAIKEIKDIYKWSVVKKQPRGDFLGRLDASLKCLEKDPAIAKYAREIKMAKTARQAITKDRSKLSTAQAQQTTVR